MYTPHSAYSFICQWIFRFFPFAIVINAAMIMRVQVSHCDPDFKYFGYILRSRSTGSTPVLFLIFEEMPYCFPQQLHNFAFLPTVYKVPTSPHFHQYLISFLLCFMVLGFCGGFFNTSLLEYNCFTMLC